MIDYAQELLVWYERNRRRMPWRGIDDPYAIWVSEVMLQQTRVETVRTYFSEFLRRFPSVDRLAEAPLDEVLAAWSGLGYYRRARHLHAAARRIVELGEFPKRAEELRKLPGIGSYTAAAVASIAFGERVAVLDGNVERVISRWLAFGEPSRTAGAKRRLRAEARQLLDPERPGDSNQALMELGSLVCRPLAPKCASCPLEPGCAAWRAEEPESYPRAIRRRATERRQRLAVVVERRGKVLLFRRGEDEELLAGIWEVPWVEDDGRRGEKLEERLAGRYGGSWTLGATTGRVRHGITYRDLEVEVRRGRRDGGGVLADGPEANWFCREEIAELPTSSLLTKILASGRFLPSVESGETETRRSTEPEP